MKQLSFNLSRKFAAITTSPWTWPVVCAKAKIKPGEFKQTRKIFLGLLQQEIVSRTESKLNSHWNKKQKVEGFKS